MPGVAGLWDTIGLVEPREWEDDGFTLATAYVSALFSERAYLHIHEFADEDPDAHQTELMLRCGLAENGREPAVQMGDAMQIAVEWIELSSLPECRLYPKILRELLAVGLPTDGAVYLGDVN